MKAAQTMLLLFCTFGALSAQDTVPKGSFTTAVDTLRATMLKLSSNHTLTNTDGTTLQYDISILEVSANPSTCTLTWKERVNLGVSSQVHTFTVPVRGIETITSVRSDATRLILAPVVQIVRLKTFAYTPLADTSENFKADGTPKGTPATKQTNATHIYTSSEPEAALVIKQLTAVMTTCTP